MHANNGYSLQRASWLTAPDCNFNYTQKLSNVLCVLRMKKNEKNFNYACSWSENSGSNRTLFLQLFLFSFLATWFGCKNFNKPTKRLKIVSIIFCRKKILKLTKKNVCCDQNSISFNLLLNI